MSDSLFGLGNLVTDSGRTRFSGAGGGFPTQDIVEASLAPQRERIDSIETSIEDTQFQNQALETLRERVSDVRSAARQLSDEASIDNAGNVFESKVLGQASTSRFDSQSASDPADLLGVTLDNTAQVQDHQLEILQTAQAEQVTSTSFSSSTAALGDGNDPDVADNQFKGEFRIGTEAAVRTSDSVEDPTATLANSGLVNDDTSEFELEVFNDGGTLGSTAVIDADVDSLQDVATEIDGIDGSISATVNDSNQLEVESSNGPVRINSINEVDDPSFLENANIGRATISTGDSDSLVDVRDKINNADRDVSASVVEVADNDFRLQVTSDKTGTQNELELEDISNNPLADLGILDGSGNKNVTQQAQNARFTADNVKEQEAGTGNDDVARTERVSDSSLTLQELGFLGSSSATLDITDDGTGDTISVTLNPGDTLNDVRDNINSKSATANNTELSASITGDNELQIDEIGNNNSLSFDDNKSNFLESSNLDKEIFERQSNTVDDVFEGVTLDFRKAEDGTTIDLPVQRDLAGVKETVQNFVDSFNAARQFINAQRQEVQLEGQSEDTVGALAQEPVLDDVEQQLSNAVTGVARNVTTDFSVLREIGVNFVDNDNVSDPTQADTLEIEESELDDALSQNFESVRQLFGFNLRASDPDLTMLDFGAQTGAVSDFTLTADTDGNGDLQDSTTLTDGDGNSVPFEIRTDSDNNNTSSLEVTDGPAEGLVLSFNEPGVTGRTINFDTSRGIGADSFFASQNISTNRSEGVIESAVQTREDQNTDRNDRVDRLESQLEQERERLLERFSSVEGTLARLGQQQQLLQARLGGN